MAIPVISAIFGLFGKAIQPIADLIDDERFTKEERAQFANAQEMANIAKERTGLEIEKLQWQVQVEEQKRLAAEAMASADRQTALAQIQQSQTLEDDLYTKRLRPTVGYLMTVMLIADQVWSFLGHDGYFGWQMLTGYFAIMGIYMGGRSVEKIKRDKVPKNKDYTWPRPPTQP